MVVFFSKMQQHVLIAEMLLQAPGVFLLLLLGLACFGLSLLQGR